MIMDKALEKIINEVLDNYGITDNREQIFNQCYFVGLEAKVNPKVLDYLAYAKGTTINIANETVQSLLGL